MGKRSWFRIVIGRADRRKTVHLTPDTHYLAALWATENRTTITDATNYLLSLGAIDAFNLKTAEIQEQKAENMDKDFRKKVREILSEKYGQGGK